MRLIDADAILQDIEECANAVEIQIHLGKCNEDVAKGMLNGLALVREDILRKDTAYDVENVVAEEENFLVNYGIPKNTAVHRKIIGIIRKGGVE